MLFSFFNLEAAAEAADRGRTIKQIRVKFLEKQIDFR